jgi:hypothetical protein
MARAAFEKIKAGLDDAEAYLDGTGDKSRYLITVSQREGAEPHSSEGTALSSEKTRIA